MKRRLSTQVSAGFAFIVLITVFIISLAGNLLISHQFEKYVQEQQRIFSESLADGLVSQYDTETETWNTDYIHGFGMYALNDGYILRLYDLNGEEVWDAENHDMKLCHQIMNDISRRMEELQPDLEGDFVSHRYELRQNGTAIGSVEISYYSPYYFNENAFRFVDSLNYILAAAGVLSLLGAVAAGFLFARRISGPIEKTVQITEDIAEGNYKIRFAGSVKTKELNNLTQAVNHMAEALDEQETMRRRLTTDVAHELRTPLANVSSHLEAMIEGVWEPEPERLQSCYDEISRISQIVSDLEKLRQVEDENLKLEKTPMDLFSLSQAVCAGFEPMFEEKRLTCSVTGEAAIIKGDKNRLYQVISNLISNAIKYSFEGGHIRISVKDAGGNGILTVEDEGIGISENERSLVFERFYRTDRSRSRETGGVGIGLTIVKSVIQAHGGTVAVRDKDGPGVCFVVTLPKD